MMRHRILAAIVILLAALFPADALAQDPCAVEAVREYIYAGGRLLAVVGPAAPVTIAFATDASTVVESAGAAAVAVRLTTSDGGPAPCPVSVRYATTPGSAVAGSDFTAATGTLSFPAASPSGETQEIPVPILDDALNELAETLSLSLTSPTGAAVGTPAVHTVTIADDDPIPALSIEDVTVTEGSAGPTSASFTVSLSAPSGQVVSLLYATGDGTATAGSDYIAASGTLAFAPGTTQQKITVAVVSDAAYEPNETFFVNLTVPSHATLARGQAVGTILNDDLPQLTIDGVVVSEAVGTAVITVKLTPALDTAVSVAYRTRDRSATAGQDYQATGGTLAFDPGVTSLPLSVPILQDTVYERIDESFMVELLTPVGAQIATGYARVSIKDDDPNPSPPKADFNGDGQEDILWRHQLSGTNQVWHLTGQPRVALIGGTYLPGREDTDWQIAGTGDFDRDGRPDILWRSTWTGDNQVWLMDGATVKGSAYIAAVYDTDWQVGGVADFNRDGWPDILWRHRVRGDNVVWFMNGLAIAGGATLNPVPDSAWEIGGTGDFDGDGKVDIVWRHQAVGANVVWFMDGVTKKVGASLTSVPDTGWRMVGVSDFDGDGKPDLLWRHRWTGEVSIWLMDGITLRSGVTLPTVIDPNWKVGAPR